MEYINIIMEICMMVSGNLTEKTEREFFTIMLISLFMKVVGMKMKKKDMELRNMTMGLYMKGIGRMVLKKEEEF